jgi:hypothetical protein
MLASEQQHSVAALASTLTSKRVRASVNAHSRAHTQNPNEFEVRFIPNATYTGYKLIMRDFNFIGPSFELERDVTLTNSAYPESLAQTCFVMQHLSHNHFTPFVN